MGTAVKHFGSTTTSRGNAFDYATTSGIADRAIELVPAKFADAPLSLVENGSGISARTL